MTDRLTLAPDAVAVDALRAKLGDYVRAAATAGQCTPVSYKGIPAAAVVPMWAVRLLLAEQDRLDAAQAATDAWQAAATTQLAEYNADPFHDRHGKTCPSCHRQRYGAAVLARCTDSFHLEAP